MKPIRPPRLLEKLFRWLSPPHDRENLVGDHQEVYHRIKRTKGKRKASIWYLGNIIRMVPIYLENEIRGGLAMLKSYIKIALRYFKRYRGFSFINLMGLAVGMACTILIFLWVQYEWSFDRFHTKAERIHQVVYVSDDGNVRARRLQGPLAAQLKAAFPEIVDATVYYPWRKKLVYEGNGIFCDGAYVQPSFFKMFDFPFTAGAPERAFSSLNSIVITEKLACRLFGSNDPMGKTISYFAFTEGIDLQVTGVLQDIPFCSHLQFEFLIPYALGPDFMQTWNNKCLFTYVELHETSSQQDIESKIIGEVKRNRPGSVNNLYLQALTDIHLYDLHGGGRITYVYVFTIMAVLILLIAVINFTNLSTARSETRFREIGVRKALGSVRSQLIRQFLSESVLMAFLAGGVAVVLVAGLLPSVSRILNADLSMPVTPIFLAALIGVAAGTGILAGIYPAFMLSGLSPVSVLKGSAVLRELIPGRFGRKGKALFRGSYLRRGLVVFQFTLTIAFLIGVTVIFRQLNHIRRTDLGYDQQHVICIPLTGELQQQVSIVKQELLNNPAILSATVTAYRQEMWESSSRDVSWPGKASDDEVIIGNNYVDFDYLKTFKMEMAAGRFFSREFLSEARRGVVINEAAVKAMGLINPVSKILVKNSGGQNEQELSIIGVIKDFNTQSLHREIRPFMHQVSTWGNYLYIRIDGQDIPASLEFIRSQIQEIVPEDPVAYQFLDERIDALYTTESMVAAMVRYGTILALIIACLGLLGLAAFSVERRTKEMGIRKILGASANRLAAMLTVDLLKGVLWANLIAWPIAYLVMQQWLEGFAYRISLGIGTFIWAAAVSLTIAVLTVVWQTIKAALANPADTLRYE